MPKPGSPNRVPWANRIPVTIAEIFPAILNRASVVLAFLSHQNSLFGRLAEFCLDCRQLGKNAFAGRITEEMAVYHSVSIDERIRMAKSIREAYRLKVLLAPLAATQDG